MQNVPDNLPIRVTACPHPFKVAHEDYALVPGQSLWEILVEVQPDISRYRAHVWVNNDYIPPEMWRTTYPAPGSVIAIRVVPQGGVGRMIGMVFIAIAAIAVAVLVPPLGASMGLWAAGSMWGTLVGGLAAMAVGIIGNMILNALCPPTTKAPGALGSMSALSAMPGTLDYGATSPTLSITGAQNKANKYGPIPKILGKHKMAPPYGASTYTESVGADQYLRLIFIWGFSPIQIEDLSIGQTPLSNFQGVEVEHRNLTLYLTAQTIAIDISARTLTRTTGSWHAEGIKAGDSVTLGGCTTAANNTTYAISAVTDLVLTYSTATATTTEAGNGAQTVTVTWGDDDISLYPVTIEEEALSIALVYNLENTHTSHVDADELSVDVVCPNGIMAMNTDGSTANYTVKFTVLYRETGTSGAWLTPSGTNGAGQAASSIILTARSKSSVRGSLRWKVTRGQYDIKLKRLTVDDNIWHQSISYWTSLRTITNEDPINFPHPLAKTAMRIKATGQLNGTVDEFTGVCTSVVPDWDTGTSTWITRATQNPASLYRGTVQGDHCAQPLADARLDLTKLQYWHEYCETNGWKYNKVVDYRTTTKDVLDEIAAAGRAAFSWIDSKLGVIIDEPQTFAIGPHFTPRNILKGSFSSTVTYPDLPHAWRIQFPNEDMQYQMDERIVLDDGYQIDDLDAWGNSHPEYTAASVFEQLELPGITDPDLIFKHGRYHIAAARLRPETSQFGTDIEWLVATRGDRIKFAHDVMLAGLSWGRVTAVQTDESGYISGVTLDELMEMEVGKNYVLRFRLADNTSLLCPIVTDATVGGVHTVALTTPINPADDHPVVKDLALFGEAGLEAIDLIIKSIMPDSSLNATVTAVTYDENIYLADVGTIPAHDPKISVPVEWWTPIVSWVRSDGTVLVRATDGSWQSRILLTLLRPAALDGNITRVECRYRVHDSDEPFILLPVADLDNGEVSIMPVEDGLEYEYQLRYVKKNGSRGGWSTLATHTVEGKTAPPENVTGFMVTQVESVVTAYWTPVADRDLAGYEIRFGASGCTWAEAQVVNGAYNGTTFSTTIMPPGTWDILIKAIDTTGNYSATEARKTFVVFQFYDILSALTEAPLWAGTLTNLMRNPRTGNLNPADQDIPNGNDFNVFDNYIVNPYATMSYECPEVDLGGDETARLWGRIYSNLGPGEAGSNTPQLSVDYKLDAGAYDGFENWTIGFLEGRYVKSKVTVTAAIGLLRLTDMQVTLDQAV